MISSLRFGDTENLNGMVGIFTARKRSLGQGNMFTGVCLSTGGGGGLVLGVPAPGGPGPGGWGYLVQIGGAWSGGVWLGGACSGGGGWPAPRGGLVRGVAW